jgi:ATP-dependent DNA helicase UvrD/PcrA
VSQFVLEALDLGKDAARPFRSRAVEEIERFAPAAETAADDLQAIAPTDELTISHKQIDDYQTCPLKYRYVHVLRVPILRHHAVAYGAVVHKVVEYYLLRRAAGNFTPLDDLLDAYERAWAGEDIIRGRPGSGERAEGFLTREHEDARKAAGHAALTRFWQEEEADGTRPVHVEKEFGFTVGRDRVRGRFDRVDEEPLGAVIVDYKTGELKRQKDADRRAAESLQLKVYSVAWREMTGALPLRVELRFVDAHLVGRHVPGPEDVEEAMSAVKAAAAGIRARHFEATPALRACRYCAYNQICPSTATRE